MLLKAAAALGAAALIAGAAFASWKLHRMANYDGGRVKAQIEERAGPLERRIEELEKRK